MNKESEDQLFRELRQQRTLMMQLKHELASLRPFILNAGKGEKSLDEADAIATQIQQQLNARASEWNLDQREL